MNQRLKKYAFLDRQIFLTSGMIKEGTIVVVFE
jgi:hypothetical protein